MAVRIEVGIDSLSPEVLAPSGRTALGYPIGDMDRAGIYLDLVPRGPFCPSFICSGSRNRRPSRTGLHLDPLEPEAAETIEPARLARGLTGWRRRIGQ